MDKTKFMDEISKINFSREALNKFLPKVNSPSKLDLLEEISDKFDAIFQVVK